MVRALSPNPRTPWTWRVSRRLWSYLAGLHTKRGHRSRQWAALGAFALLAASTVCNDPVQHPSPNPKVPVDEAGVIDALANAYRNLDYAALDALLAPDFAFWFDAPVDGALSWGKAEEQRISRRMLSPQSIRPSEPPVDMALWPARIEITLTPNGRFRVPLYDPPLPDLDPEHWRIAECDYAVSLLLHVRSDNDYQITGRASFIVLDDLTKPAGAAGKFMLYDWQDRGPAASAKTGANESKSWTGLKWLYHG